MEIKFGVEKLKSEIIEIARREAAAIEADAAAEAARLLAAAKAGAEKEHAASQAAARDEAGRLRAMMLASVPAEAARLRAAAFEALLDSIKGETSRRLAAEGAGSAARLAAQAIRGMEGDSFLVTVMPADNKPGLAEEIAALSGRNPEIRIEAGDLPGGGGAMVSSADGTRRWDNSFEARLSRAWPRLRGALVPQAEKINER